MVERGPVFMTTSTGSRFARTEPRYNKFACHTPYLLAICFAPSLTDSTTFLRLTRLVVVIILRILVSPYSPPSRRLS
jgi:hypothetical protein